MLKDLGVSYFFLNIVNIVSVPALLFIAPVWRKQVERFSWRGTLTIAVGLYFPHLFVLGFVTRETLFLYPIAMISAILVSPGINLVMANMAYMNLPERDQTAYIGLYVSLNSLAAFLGSAVGASFILSTSNLHFEIGGMLLGNKQLLLVITGVMMALYVLAMMSRSGKNSK
jgi:fucose permease